jgi:hypothetical protein
MISSWTSSFCGPGSATFDAPLAVDSRLEYRGESAFDEVSRAEPSLSRFPVCDSKALLENDFRSPALGSRRAGMVEDGESEEEVVVFAMCWSSS